MLDPKEKREIEQSEARDKLAKMLAGMVPFGSSAYELRAIIIDLIYAIKITK